MTRHCVTVCWYGCERVDEEYFFRRTSMVSFFFLFMVVNETQCSVSWAKVSAIRAHHADHVGGVDCLLSVCLVKGSYLGLVTPPGYACALAQEEPENKSLAASKRSTNSELSIVDICLNGSMPPSMLSYYLVIIFYDFFMLNCALSVVPFFFTIILGSSARHET